MWQNVLQTFPNPNQARERDLIIKIKWCGARTFISNGPGYDRIIHHGVLVSCSQVPCVVKFSDFGTEVDASSCSECEPHPVYCMVGYRVTQTQAKEGKCWQDWVWKSKPGLTLNTQTATSYPSQTATPCQSCLYFSFTVAQVADFYSPPSLGVLFQFCLI